MSTDKSVFRFQFQSPGKMVFGQGSVKVAGKELSRLGAQKALLVTDEVLAESSMVASVKDALGDKLADIFSGVKQDSSLDIVNKGAELAIKSGSDSVVSVGGGSSIDTAKGISVLLAKKDEDIRNHMGFFKVGKDVAPHICIPTTAGTGSECTGVAVIKDHEKNVKLLLVDNGIIPPAAILDPEMTVSMPPGLTAGTGMDAMTHAIEAIVSTRHMPPADALAAHAISLLVKYLPLACEDGADIEARSMNLVAASEAGMAFQNALVGIVHAMAHALGGILGVPHGLANAILLPEGMEYNLNAVPERLALVARAMGIAPSGDDIKDGAAAVQKVRELLSKLELPRSLRHAGVKDGDLEECAKLALADASMVTNPRTPAGPEEIIEIYRRVL